MWSVCKRLGTNKSVTTQSSSKETPSGAESLESECTYARVSGPTCVQGRSVLNIFFLQALEFWLYDHCFWIPHLLPFAPLEEQRHALRPPQPAASQGGSTEFKRGASFSALLKSHRLLGAPRIWCRRNMLKAGDCDRKKTTQL